MNGLAAFLTLAALAIANVHSHDMYVLNSPDYVQLNRSVSLRATELADVISSMFGFTVSNGAQTWKNLLLADPFSLPEAVVVLEIPGLKNPGFDLNKVDHHDLVLDQTLDDVYDTVGHRMKERLANKEYSLLHGSLTNEEFLKSQIFHPNFKLNPNFGSLHIDADDEKYQVFLNEIFNLFQLGQGIKEHSLKNNIPDFHWFQLQSIKSLAAIHTPNSQEVVDGEEALNEAISVLVQSYNEVYNNQVFFVAITNDQTQSRRNKREVGSTEERLNIAEPVSSDYPVIFNLFLWFTVAFIFSLIAISLTIGTMDPGRDSIIYRMTSNRMKKEN